MTYQYKDDNGNDNAVCTPAPMGNSSPCFMHSSTFVPMKVLFKDSNMDKCICMRVRLDCQRGYECHHTQYANVESLPVFAGVKIEINVHQVNSTTKSFFNVARNRSVQYEPDVTEFLDGA